MLKMFKWLMPKPQKFLFKVTYCSNALIDIDNAHVTIDTAWKHEAYVAGENLLDAGAAFAKTHPLTPHVYIHKIEKCIAQNQ